MYVAYNPNTVINCLIYQASPISYAVNCEFVETAAGRIFNL